MVWRASLTGRRSVWMPRGWTTGRAAWRVARALDTLPLQLELDDEQRAHAQRGGGRHGGGPRQSDYAAAHHDALRPERETEERDRAGEEGNAGSPFPEEDGFVDVDAGWEIDNGDDMEDDWVDPVLLPPVSAPAPVEKSKSASGKSKEGKEKREKKSKRKKVAAVPVPGVHYPFPVSVEDGAEGGGRQQHAEERETERQRVSPHPPAQGRSEGQRMHTARACLKFELVSSVGPAGRTSRRKTASDLPQTREARILAEAPPANSHSLQLVLYCGNKPNVKKKKRGS
ncbi:hypothetical protein C8J57DRAFT_1468103 [Mycena rebaudengoi]|nr:hypothetical protein C8J57DRAFT_1468103 [Mycena rebaudengoi]